jgi:hypothetical protein
MRRACPFVAVIALQPDALFAFMVPIPEECPVRSHSLPALLRSAATTALIATAAFSPTASAQQRSVTLFTLTDVRGDDKGAGDLIYPTRTDFESGDLDLVSLSAEMAEGGTWFTAVLGGTIRKPADTRGAVGPESLDRVARLGFYTFNIDIYIDTDRRPGSGNTATAPGRGVQIDRRDAWEKAVLLTPRPEIARQMMSNNAQRVLEEQRRAQVGVVTAAEAGSIERSVESAVSQRYFFPTKVQVNKREIRFFVSDSFLGGKANPAWAYSVIITASDVEPSQRLIDLPLKDEIFNVMMMPVAPGRAEKTLGVRGRGDINQPPVLDLLNSDATLQSRILTDFDAVAGRVPRLVGVVPTGRNQTVWEAYKGAPAGPGSVASAAPPKPFAPTDRDAAAALSGAPILPGPVAESGSAAAAGLGQASVGGERKTVAQRLRELSELKQQNAITEEEYQDARRRILSGL